MPVIVLQNFGKNLFHYSLWALYLLLPGFDTLCDSRPDIALVFPQGGPRLMFGDGS